MLKIIRKIVIALLVIILVVVVGAIVYFKFPVRSYYKASTKGFKIPGISKNFIPQGISYDESKELYFVTGYMKDGSASPIYIVEKSTGKLMKTVRMLNPDQTAFLGHAGGLSVYNGKIFVAGGFDACLYGFDLDAIMQAEDHSGISYDTVVDLNDEEESIGIAWTTVHNGMLYAGEFYREQNYPTLESHHIETASGMNHALAIGFTLDGDEAIPEVAYSIPDLAQGVCMDEHNIYVSTSYGVAFSHIYTFSQDKIVNMGSRNIFGVDVPFYVLDQSSLVSDQSIAPMSEEIEIVDGQMYVMCESASNKYIFGKLTGAGKCYKTELSFFEGR